MVVIVYLCSTSFLTIRYKQIFCFKLTLQIHITNFLRPCIYALPSKRKACFHRTIFLKTGSSRKVYLFRSVVSSEKLGKDKEKLPL